MRKFVGDITPLARLGRERVIHDDHAIRRRPKRACREGIGLNVFEFVETFSWDQLVSGSDLDTQQLGKNFGLNGLSGHHPQFRPHILCDSLSFGLKPSP